MTRRVRHVCLHQQPQKTGNRLHIMTHEKFTQGFLSSRDQKVNMAAAQNAGTNSITKVLESICRERRREHLDKESEGNFNALRLT